MFCHGAERKRNNQGKKGRVGFLGGGGGEGIGAMSFFFRLFNFLF